MLTNKLFYIIAIVILFVISIFGGYFYGLNRQQKIVEDVTPLKEKSDFSRQVDDSVDSFSLAGSITEMGTDFFIIQHTLPNQSEGSEKNTVALRKVFVNKNTRLVTLASPVYSSLEKLPPMDTMKPIVLPPPPEQRILRFNDFKVGDEVTALSQENLKDKKEFTAISLQRFYKGN